ncbi:aldehyde:ferredoxin oxidoreductase [Thermanaeromonas toyohensis ToBE]|uniref:Aldehyde:ferredoxin oxidoreductase n=1 Tax=Thermanaeromonas toyohensis ToBE TaxID=698762 RepID=A0A1W1VV36_9FIRM|nr:aldehyde ferredoxin oxidoreductase family protein [Thermanaeromonas toyohensis]SMB97219.1 aldehyde:ferredoxin oxidoreductase [Thermanaeromonas toyohensis ToBE]
MATLKGLAGHILRVNLTTGDIAKEATPVEIFAEYIGGRGVGAYLLFKELKPHTDPLGPDNKLIFLTGPVEGTLAPGSNKMTVTFRSPLTGTYSFSLCGGHLAPELKFAGYDGIIIEGKASHPVYLFIDDDKVELRDASHLWGKLTHATEDAIRTELRDKSIRIACIGPAGERLCRFACIQSDYHREFGRGGAGAVMGAKNLKAIAIRGTNGIEVADPASLEALVEKCYEILANNPKAQARRRYGTPELVDSTNAMGYWGTRNFTTGYFEAAEKLSGSSMEKNIFVGHLSCYACPIACGKVSYVKYGPYAGTKIEGPEFESTGLLGANCGVDDLGALVKAVEICDLYGLDTMSAGAVVSLAMECYEKGVLTKQDTGGIDLRFGQGEALVAILEKIAQREGLGDLLAEGSKRAAEKLGVPELAMQVKGQEFATYEPRGLKGMGLTYAISPKGAHHMIAPTMGPETAGNGSKRLEYKGKAALVREMQLLMAIVDSLALCSSMRFALGLKEQVELYKAVTGRDIDENKALILAEKIVNVERLFNWREGFDRKQDTLPPRMLEEPMPSGPSQGQVVELEAMLDEYYDLMGWDRQGYPTRGKLEELGLVGLL